MLKERGDRYPAKVSKALEPLFISERDNVRTGSALSHLYSCVFKPFVKTKYWTGLSL